MNEAIHMAIWLPIPAYIVARKAFSLCLSGGLRRTGNHPTYLKKVAPLPTPGGLWPMSRPERVALRRGCTDNSAWAQVKVMPVKEIPPTPLF